MDQIYEAEEKGQTEMQLLVLVANRENALSFSAPFHGQRIMRTMLRHHLIHSWIDVEMKSSYEVNELFRLDEELQPMDAEARSE